MRALVLILFFITLGAPAGRALAEKSDPTTDAAAAHHQTGQRFFEAGDFEKARIEFEAAYKLSKEPDLLYNIALCYEREGSLRSALTAYETYAAARPEDEAARTKIKRMRADLGVSPMPTQTSASPARKFTTRQITGLALVGVGAVALIATIGLAASTEKDRRALESGSLTFTEATATADRAAGTRGGAIGLGVVFGLSVGVGIPLIVLPQK